MFDHDQHGHTHRSGLPWIDLVLAGSAVFISVVSVVISIGHGRTMEKLVAANEKQVRASTLPILRFGTGNMSDGERAIHFDLRNGGTGPAIVQWLQIKWEGRPTDGPGDLLVRCCGMPRGQSLTAARNVASGMTVPAGQAETIFTLPEDSGNPAVYQKLNVDARFKIEVEACYCSVLDECWWTDFIQTTKNVGACEKVPDSQRW